MRKTKKRKKYVETAHDKGVKVYELLDFLRRYEKKYGTEMTISIHSDGSGHIEYVVGDMLGFNESTPYGNIYQLLKIALELKI